MVYFDEGTNSISVVVIGDIAIRQIEPVFAGPNLCQRNIFTVCIGKNR